MKWSDDAFDIVVGSFIELFVIHISRIVKLLVLGQMANQIVCVTSSKDVNWVQNLTEKRECNFSIVQNSYAIFIWIMERIEYSLN